MRRLLASAAFAILGSGTVLAADLPVRYNKAPPPLPVAAVYNWSGFYVGGHFGGGISRNEFGSTNQNINNVLPDEVGGSSAYSALLEAFENGATGPGGQLGVGSHNATGPLGGIQAGYNWQAGYWLLGIEGEYSFANLKGDNQNSSAFGGLINDPFNCIGTCTGSLSGTLNDRFSSNVRGIASIAGRLGVVNDRTLFYLKGGAAWARTDYALAGNLTAGGTATDSCGAYNNGCIPTTATAAFTGSGLWSGASNRWGYIAGIGMEYGLFGNWTAKIEYDYMGFGTRNVTLNGTGSLSADCVGSCGLGTFPTTVTGQSSRTIRVSEDIQVVKLGLNYRFDLGKGPIAARY